MYVFAMFLTLIFAALANLFGGKEGVGVFVGYGRGLSWAITLGLFLVVLLLAGCAVNGRWNGVFIDRDNRISLSRFQIVIWTVLLVGSLFTAGLSNAGALDGARVADQMRGELDANGALNITIPSAIWALLGLGTLTAVMVPAIKDRKRGNVPKAGGGGNGQQATLRSIQACQNLKQEPIFEGLVLAKKVPDDARWMDLILGDYEGSAYVSSRKLQQLAFTVLLVIVYGRALWTVMSTDEMITRFPNVSPGFLALLAISHAGYLVGQETATD